MAHPINCLKYGDFYIDKEASEVEAYLNETFDSPTEIKDAVNDENKDGSYPIHLATIYGNPDVLDLLLKKGADPNKYTKITKPGSYQRKLTALHYAAKAENSSYEKVKILIKYGANIELKSGEGWRAIHYAAAYSCCNTLELLIKEGANRWLRIDNSNQTPLKSAKYPLELARDNYKISENCIERLFFNSSSK